MVQAEKCRVHVFDTVRDITPEILSYRAFYVKNNPENKLDVGNGCRPMPNRIVCFGKCSVLVIAGECFEDGEQ